MGLLYLLVGLACGVAVGMGIQKRGASASSRTPGPEAAETATGVARGEETSAEIADLPRFPDVEYDVEPEDL